MGSVKDRLLKAAALRTKTVELEGESYTVREVGAVAFSQYAETLKSGDKIGAIGVLLQDCVVNDDGTPVLTFDEAKEVARCTRVAVPLTDAILAVSGFAEKEPVAR